MQACNPEFKTYEPGKAYWFQVVVYEENGDWLSFARNLRGAATFGTSIQDALDMIKDCIKGLFESYTISGQEVPWTNDEWYEIDGEPHLREFRIIIELEQPADTQYEIGLDP